MLKTKTGPKPTIRFHYADVVSIPLKNKKEVKEFVESLFGSEGKEVSTVSYVFCSDEYLLDINRAYLQHDYYTDIITFDLSNTSSALVAEIYISIPRVRENAQIHGTTATDELLRVIFHGALHLCGYRDKKKSEITIMRGKEDEYLRLFGKKN
jgi:probable rRNA maturation factor